MRVLVFEYLMRFGSVNAFFRNTLYVLLILGCLCLLTLIISVLMWREDTFQMHIDIHLFLLVNLADMINKLQIIAYSGRVIAKTNLPAVSIAMQRCLIIKLYIYHCDCKSTVLHQ